MLNQDTTHQVRRTRDRRAQSHNLIKDLIDTRTKMLVLYSKLAANKSTEPEDSLPGILQEFCQTLIDYTASAHFHMYRHIEEKMEKRVQIKKLAESFYPRIMSITKTIIDFNDNYDSWSKVTSQEKLEADLSVLGEQLAERIELEDKLIEALSSTRSPDTKQTTLHS
ncbi:MAG: Rsd/AlgQ family anti-sigma factor [Gammaproteobacteria bacterium]|nr:Rsd/AlgQ family anti-sigma factor [Gammaproteobacteria bacterium]